MRISLLILSFLVMYTTGLKAQNDPDYSAIKLYINNQNLAYNNQLPAVLINRLSSKITQLINQTGVAEIGYSNFLVVPKFDILSTSEDDAGMSKVFLTECELVITIERQSYGKGTGAVFASFSRRLTGSALTKNDAISNAINNLSTNDEALVSFLKRSKVKISEYFQAHCQEVIEEAEHAYKLNDYGKSIALYFSIPSNAPQSCYKSAKAASMKVYTKYLEDKCNLQLIRLKAYVARAQNTDEKATFYYDSALKVMNELDPASADCYAEARKQIEKIEQRFDERQKQEWELRRKKVYDEAEVKKEMYKAMVKMGTTYKPEQVAPTVIIAK